MPDQPTQQPVQLSVEWIESDAPVLFANAFVVQQVKDEFVLGFGVFTVPLSAVGKQMTVDDLRALKTQIKPIVRIGMTPGRLAEFATLLQGQLKAYMETLDKEPN